MPGKIFINETADKQKVELTTGADGVTGGYYDPEGVWHDFGGGGGTEFFEITLTLTADSYQSGFPIISKFGDYYYPFIASFDPGETKTGYAYTNMVLYSDDPTAILMEVVNGPALIVDQGFDDEYQIIVTGEGSITIRLFEGTTPQPV